MRRVILALAAMAALAFMSCTTPGRDSVATEAGRDNVLGPSQASVTIEEWGDFQCPACRNFATLKPRIEQAVLTDGKTRFVFRHMAFLGPESILAAEAAECAGDQGRFWDYHDMLYASQDGENRGAFVSENLKGLGETVGLEQGAFASCVDTHKYNDRVVSETQRGTKLGVNSTPTLLVNGQRIALTTTRDPVETIRIAIQNAKPR